MKRIFTLLAFAGNFLFLSAYGQVKPITDYHATAPTKFIEANGTNYAYRIFGNPKGAPVLLLQHFTGTMDNWDPAVTNGLAKDFRVILLDNKGIGASGGQTPVNIEDMAQDAIAFLNAMGLKKVNVLGFSMGGFIAQQMALDQPDLIDRIILAGTAPKGGAGVSDIVQPLTATASMTPNDSKLYLFYTETPFSRNLGIKAQQRINSRTVNRDKETSGASVQAQLQSILSWGAPDADALNHLKQVRQPVLIVNGSNDIVVPTPNSYVLFQNLPNAKLSLYPDSGHGSIFQYPELFLEEAISFLKTKK